MDRTEFIIATTLVLFGAFVLGWFACWLIGRLTRPAQADLRDLVRQLHDAEQGRETALATLAERETRLAAAEAELEAAMDGLRESRTEIEELRDYIERRLARQ